MGRRSKKEKMDLEKPERGSQNELKKDLDQMDHAERISIKKIRRFRYGKEKKPFSER